MSRGNRMAFHVSPCFPLNFQVYPASCLHFDIQSASVLSQYLSLRVEWEGPRNILSGGIHTSSEMTLRFTIDELLKPLSMLLW